MQAGADMTSTRARGRQRFDVRLAVIGHDLARNYPAALDGLKKEGRGTRCVAVLTQ